jgi:UvrD/REP helicase N-terminal domain
VNPFVLSALRRTYGFVFLDEFQDTTDLQYQLTLTAFLGSGAILTAVGDPRASPAPQTRTVMQTATPVIRITSSKELRTALKQNADNALIALGTMESSVVKDNRISRTS